MCVISVNEVPLQYFMCRKIMGIEMWGLLSQQLVSSCITVLLSVHHSITSLVDRRSPFVSLPTFPLLLVVLCQDVNFHYLVIDQSEGQEFIPCLLLVWMAVGLEIFHTQICRGTACKPCSLLQLHTFCCSKALVPFHPRLCEIPFADTHDPQ